MALSPYLSGRDIGMMFGVQVKTRLILEKPKTHSVIDNPREKEKGV